MIFEFQINDNVESINLKTKRNGYPLCSFSCTDCTYYGYEYEITTTNDTIILKYSFDGSSTRAICGKMMRSDINDPPEDIRAVLNLLYIIKLEKLILNRDYDFYPFEYIFNWEKNYR